MTKRYSRILVTGGAGFIGSHIVDRHLNDGYDVTVIDNLYMGHLENIAHNQDKSEFHYVKGDIMDARPGELKRGYADIGKAKRMLNYAPKFSFEKGIADLVDWYARN